MKVAIVHDYLNQYGGAEKILEVVHEIFPQAPIFTSIFLPENLSPIFSTLDVRMSFLQKFPFLEKHFKKYLILYPCAMESLDLSGFDLIFSTSSAFAKGIRVPEKARHICYCYTPMRFVWDRENYFLKEAIHPIYRWALPLALSYLKKWDLETNARVDHFVAVSDHIRKRIERCYIRSADVIYPPVVTSQFKLSPKTEDYFLVVSRLNPYKRIDLVIEVFNRLSLPLIVIGTGPQEAILRKMAESNVTFLGKVSEEVLIEKLSRCRAFIFPGEEDFGIAPIEAMASGRPVIAYARGGALETVVDGVTGLFFKKQTINDLIDAIHRFEKIEFNRHAIRRHAQQFDKEIFQEKIRSFINDKFRAFHENF